MVRADRRSLACMRALSSAGSGAATNDLATAYRVRKMALVGRIGLIQQRVKTGDADDDDIMQLATLQTELSDLDAKIASRGRAHAAHQRQHATASAADLARERRLEEQLGGQLADARRRASRRQCWCAAPSGMISPRKANAVINDKAMSDEQVGVGAQGRVRRSSRSV
jgi:hypothetical protein